MLDRLIVGRKIGISLLIGFLVFIIIPSLVLVLISYTQSKKVIETSVFNSITFLADAQGNSINNWVNSRKVFIEGVAASDHVSSMDPNQAAHALEEYIRCDHNFTALVLADVTGQVIYDSKYNSRGSGLSVADREYFKKSLSGETHVSEILLARNSLKPTLIISTPVKQGNSVVGVLFGAVTMEIITSLIKDNIPGSNGEAYLVNQRGSLIGEAMFHADNTNNTADARDLIMSTRAAGKVSQGLSGNEIYDNHLGKKVFGSYRWLPDIKMGLVVEKEYNSAMLNAGLKTYYNVVVASLVITALFIVFAIVYSRRLSEPLERLAKEVNNIAEGDFRSVINIRANREVNELAASINYMSSNLLRRTTQLNDLIQQLEQNKAKLSEEKNTLEVISITDELTGLYNRRYINHELNRLSSLTATLGKNISLLMLDLDHFKQVNDNYGHFVGDKVLKEFALLLNKCSRNSDVVGRFGGEEFVIIVPFVQETIAWEIAERIRQEVESHIFDQENNKIKITVSIGIASMRPVSQDKNQAIVERLITGADNCLYQAKKSGRNKTVLEVLE